MLIDINDLISVSDLRRNLSGVMDEVRKGRIVYVSDRGDIAIKLSPLTQYDKLSDNSFFDKNDRYGQKDTKYGKQHNLPKTTKTPIVNRLEGILQDKPLPHSDDYTDYLTTKYA